MNILRRLGLVIFGSILTLALLGTAWSQVAASTIRNRETVKSWLSESGFYDKVITSVLENVNKASKEQGESGEGIPVDDPEIQAIAKETFSPDYLKVNIEKVLDGTYDWLEGKTDKPVFAIDLAEAKQKLADGIGNYATKRAASLPVCTTISTEEFDVLNANCLPPGVSATMAGANIRNEIITNPEFLEKTSFTGDDITIEENGQKVPIGNTSQAKVAQNGFQKTMYGPYALAFVAAMSALAIIFMSGAKRAGLRRVAGIFIGAGVVLAISFIVVDRGSVFVSKQLSVAGDGPVATRELSVNVVRVVSKDIKTPLLWYAISFVAIGAGGMIFASLYKRPKSDKPKKTEEKGPEPPTDDSPKAEPVKQAASPEPKKTKPPTKIQL